MNEHFIGRARSLSLSLGVLALCGCRQDGDAVLLLVLTASGSPPPVAAVDVTLNGLTGSSSQHYVRDDQQAIVFPTTLSATVPARAAGDLTIDVQATDATGATVATGHEGPLTVRAGDRETVTVQLSCGGSPCLVDGGTGPEPDGGVSGGSPSCGNGRLEPEETCDPAIARGDPGACPPANPAHPCDDGVPCTRDIPSGTGCTASCAHEEIAVAAVGDGCCPAGATSAEDADCSPSCGNGVVDPGEACDIALAAGTPGACPTSDDCTSGDACSLDRLISAGTCSAVCVHTPISIRNLQTSDGCCPTGATRAVDVDCPVVCGNGVLESGEHCDPGIAPLTPDSCPTGCDDGNPCTADFLGGTGCQAACVHLAITAAEGGDGCCPPGATHASDSDCAPVCGNGVLEPGEACDKNATGVNACPTSCPPSPSGCLRVALVGQADDCSARCETTTITGCSAQKDRCCPAGCTAATDPDCSAACDDGLLEPTQGETCDTAVPAGRPGACPKSCTTTNPCIEARLLSAGTCAATCVLLPITERRAGDGCCPFGADFTVDPDCAPVCGNGVVEGPSETCDRIASGSCPASCQPLGACMTVEHSGVDADCSATCVATPILRCIGGDGCCPQGCTAIEDSDCPVICGDGAVEPGERCDRAITAGTPGACPRSCNDGDACTVDLVDGSPEACTRSCSHRPITACLGGDGCCPAGCTDATDADCSPVCGDGKIGAQETCDPPAACPTTCPDDGDPCTVERLTGAATTCDAVCRHTPITTCSGTTADHCCPTGCTSATDSDC